MRCARRRGRRDGAGRRRLPGAFQRRDGHPDLRERHAHGRLPDDRAEERARERVRGRAQQRGHGALCELSVRSGHRGRRLGRVEAVEFGHARSGRDGVHVHDAAETRRDAREPRRFRARLRHGQRRAGDLRDDRRLYAIRVVVHDAARRDQPVRAEVARREAAGLSRHRRPGVLVQRHERLVRPARAGERWRRVGLRALLSGAGHESLLGRAGSRPIRHADAARRVGRAGAGAHGDRRHGARHDERGAECGRADVVGRGTHASVVSVSAGRALQRVGRREFGGELQLSLTQRACRPERTWRCATHDDGVCRPTPHPGILWRFSVGATRSDRRGAPGIPPPIRPCKP
ncbi:hypothetical protein BDI4_740043 [Burkholderia diffusa]|nr:hypothetical protein BDI4_740043 [Burkholderia diffusa]